MLIFNSSTLILLAKIDMLDIFISTFDGNILIPEKVHDEVCRTDGEEVPFISRLISERKIKVMKVKEKKQIKKLMMDFNIDRGEAEAIVLALQKGCKIIATDDRNAIRACKFLRLDFVTAISVLLRVFEKGLIERDEALAKLDKLAYIARYSEKIINDADEKIKGGD